MKINYLIILFHCCCVNLTAQNILLDAKKEIGESAVILNRKLPIKIDELTTAIIVNYDNEKNELTYFFKVDNYNNSEIYKQGIENFINKSKQSGINFIRNNPNNKSYIIAQLDFVYIYVDSNKKLICKFRITPADYNN
jgi:hypothetical protein